MVHRFSRVSAAGVVAGMLVLAGCTAGPSASVAPLETAVLLASGDGEPAEVAEEVTAAQGAVVSTDAGGLAEIVFPDSSFLRLGPESEITITELGSAEAQRTSIALDIGETWHNVQELVADDAVYEVVTPVGVASVRGTVFAITCVEGPSCAFLVLDGEIEVDGITVSPYERVVLPEQPEPEIVPVDALGDWVTANIERDAEAEDAVALPDPPLAAASIAGDWTATLTTTASDNTRSPVGTIEDFTWTIGEPECDPSCVVSVSSETGWEVTAPLVNGRIAFEREGSFECVFEDTGEPSGNTGTFQYSYELTIQGADIDAATEITGTVSGTDSLDSPGANDCDLGAGPGVTPVSETRDVVMTR